ncbi:lysine transporter LysE [Corynebacterium sp. 13CS0277]|uniref:LysE/ArgO family amino acid transporter n=1 Tax=Corynebacterium sp. 13CS0277 TaxID=2071994 RepID=UPI000D0357F7|nr:LysE/ArgO family amino acid transporter [Corynebacterium sp. 13CS0277]PRQ10757.1 lysine transporter LysE [Corynebacterium sp. 13CS0277]
MVVALHGFLVGLSLIIAIGPQNALILKQGLLRDHVALIVLICAVSDIILISAGTGGVGLLLAHTPWLLSLLTYGGAAYLTYFAYTCFRDAWHPQALSVNDAPALTPSAQDPHAAAVRDSDSAGDSWPGGSVATTTRTTRARTQAPSWRAPAMAAVMLTWLNPSAYIDTLVMIGGLANQEGPTGRWFFAAGAIAASLLWFPALGYGAMKLSTPLSKPAVWRVLNIVMGCIMLSIVARLLMH